MFEKLTSRKLWMAIAGVATGIAMVLGVDGSEISTVAGAVTTLVSVVAYIITEGKIDAEGVKVAIEQTQTAVDVIERVDEK
jgi:phage shock protein PspC (stress-responsive transcriptional regulator)